MYVLIASFVNKEINKLVGLRFIDIDGKENKVFDLTIEDVLSNIADGSISICGVTNEDELYQLSYLSSQFDVDTGLLLNEMRYIKLDEIRYADSLGQIYEAKNPVDLDNIVSGRILTEMEEEVENLVEDKAEDKAGDKAEVKMSEEDSSNYGKACGLGDYKEVSYLTVKYFNKLDYGSFVEDELLKVRRAGRFNYKLSTKKTGVLKLCVNRETGLYGICCISDTSEWVILEPVYTQLETVKINTTTYIMGCKKDKWYLLDIRKKSFKEMLLLEDIIDWFAVNNAEKKNGKLFVAQGGSKDTGYLWYLVDKGGVLGRQIGCKMLLTDVLFAKGRSYARLVDTVEFSDPRHGDIVLLNMKDYSMDSMLNFRRTLSQMTTPVVQNEDIVLYYNIVCDMTSGEIIYETDKGYKNVIRTFIDINSDFISYLALFYGVTPKDESIEVKVRKHLEQRHQYTFLNIDVETAEKVQQLLSYFTNYTSAKLLSSYWDSLDLNDINADKALNDLDISTFKEISKCNDDKPLFVKLRMIKNKDESCYCIVLSRRNSKVIHIISNELVQKGGYISEDLKTSLTIENLLRLIPGSYKVNIENSMLTKQDHNVKGVAPLDIVQKYKKTKFSIKHTTYRNVNELSLNCNIMNDEVVEFKLVLKTSDGLDFKTSDIVMKKLDTDNERKIEDVREHAKAYTKLMNESQPVLSGFYQTAFVVDII